MKNFCAALFLSALFFVPALAHATALSALTASTSTNTINNGSFTQTWNWNQLNGYGLALVSTPTTMTNTNANLYVQLTGTNANSGVTSSAIRAMNNSSGTTSTNYGIYSFAETGTHNFGIYGQSADTQPGDAGVWGDAVGTSGMTYGVYGTNASAAGYAAYFNNSAGGYAAAFMGGNVGIGTATPLNLLDVGTGGGIHIASGVPVGTSMALYNNSGTLTWNGVALATGSSVSGTTNYVPVYTGASSLGNSVIYQSGSNVGIGTTTPNQLLQINTPNGSGGEFQITNSATGAGSSNGLLVGYNASNDVVFNNQASSQEKFYTSNTFAMAITSSQQVGIQTNTPSYTLQVIGSVAGTSAYVNTSDIRLKKNVRPLEIGLNVVTQLKPVTFEWNDGAFQQLGNNIGLDGKPHKVHVEDHHLYDPAMHGDQIGFIAQDVEKILPSVVVTEDNAEKTKGMKYSELIPVLVKAMQEQQAQLAKDEATIAAMKAKLGM